VGKRAWDDSNTAKDGFLAIDRNNYHLAQEAELQQSALAAATRAELITLTQYRAGTVGYLGVLATQNNRIQAESTLWNIKKNRYSSCIALVNAIGGNW
jgi:outer membrane protein TolC